MLVKEFLAGFDACGGAIVVFRDDARREIARGHLRGILQAGREPDKCSDYTLSRLFNMEVQDCRHDSMGLYEYLTVYVGDVSH